MDLSYKFDPNVPTFYEDVYPNSWQMTRWEKFTFISLVQKFKPEVAIEIGNAEGGSLQVLAQVCKKIYALDFDPKVHDNLRPKFNNVDFRTGDSKLIMPELLSSIQKNGEKLSFVLIDGDHSTAGVRADINSILKNYVPLTDLVVIFHDSFNPICRKGIITADWQECPYVHYVDVDYLPGVFFNETYKNSVKGSMWGGLSLAILKPVKRESNLDIRQSLLPMYELLFKKSRYNSIRFKTRELIQSRAK